MSNGVAPTATGITQRVVVYYWEQEDLTFLPEQRKAVEKYIKKKTYKWLLSTWIELIKSVSIFRS